MASTKSLGGAVPFPSSSPSEQDYRTQSDVRTLADADEIQRDPARHTRAKRHALRQATVHRRIAGGFPFAGRR
jgi:hypothetical protein